MRPLALSMLLLLSLPVLAGNNDRDRRRDDDDDQELALIERDRVSRKLSRMNAGLTDAIARNKKDRRLERELKDLRALLDDLRDEVASGQQVVSQERRGRVFYIPTGDSEGWRSERWDDRNPTQVVVHHPAPPPPPAYTPPPAYNPPPPTYTPPPRPQPQPSIYPIQDNAFQGLLSALNRESFPNDRLRVLEQAAGTSYFLVAHVEQLLARFEFGRDRLKAARTLKPRILDTENFFKLYASFEFAPEKAELRKILTEG